MANRKLVHMNALQTKNGVIRYPDVGILLHILQAWKIYFGLAPQLFRKPAYESAVAKNITHPASWDINKCAGPYRFISFIK